jgi:hypothetical protein
VRISIEFEGRRWVAAGTAVRFSPESFVPRGEYRGFPVYVATTEQSGQPSRIYVARVQGSNDVLSVFTLK